MSVFEVSKAYRPFSYPWAAEAAKRQMIDLYWDVHQLDLSDDVRQYHSVDGLKSKTVSHDVNKAIVKKLLCLFTELDRTVAEGYTKIIPFAKNNEIRNLLMTHAVKEVVHQRAYAIAAETFGFSDQEWLEFQDYVEMRDKLDVMSDQLYDEQDRPEMKFCIGLSQILLGEGIGLFAAFVTLLNYKRQGRLMGFNDVNQWSLIDEQDHVDNNIKILKVARNSLTEAENIVLDKIILKLVRSYVDAEHRLIRMIYKDGEQEDLTGAQVEDYIEYLGELREASLGLRKARDVRPNPLKWMEWMLGAKHDNFFEKRVTDYSHNKLEGDVDWNQYAHLVK